MKKITMIIILGLILVIVGICGYAIKTTYTTYSGPFMSFQYPSGWNITVTNDTIVEVYGDENNDVQVLYLGNATDYAQEDARLHGYVGGTLDYKYKGHYMDNTNTSYEVFTSPPDSSGRTRDCYLIIKNGKAYEVRSITGGFMIPDPMKQVIATIN